MVDYREILRLKSLGYSRNQIEASAHISHHTVKAVLDTAESLGICWPLDEKLTNAVLQETFFPGKMSHPQSMLNRTMPGSTENWRSPA